MLVAATASYASVSRSLFGEAEMGEEGSPCLRQVPKHDAPRAARVWANATPEVREVANEAVEIIIVV